MLKACFKGPCISILYITISLSYLGYASSISVGQYDDLLANFVVVGFASHDTLAFYLDNLGIPNLSPKE